MIKKIADIIYAEALEASAPFHYKPMIERIIKKINLPEYSPNTDVVENVRNRLHYQNGRFHHYKDGYFGLTEWHVRNNQLLINDDYFRLPMKPSCIMSALHEAKNRVDYVLDKHAHGKIKHFWNLITGFIIEHHLKDWFRNCFPEYYEPPDNENDYTKPSLNDWKIRINDRLILFDSKRHYIETDIEKYRTKENRVFVLADENNVDIVVYGFTTSRWLENNALTKEKEWYDSSIKTYYSIKTAELYPFSQLQAYLNCLKMNIDFELV